ncbi:MAG TPA: aspartate carbamoyltransferase catalytic subunit, partial [Phycisphaerales bacterium]|nr:aspartate carbamoyltransferase catalytic subunit [Phycisphaerales bacterium]
ITTPPPTSARARQTLAQRHLLGIDQLSPEEIRLILDRAGEIRQLVNEGNDLAHTLAGKTLVNLFFENSTRTRVSFELAAKRLGSSVVNFDVANSSFAKGESLLDTLQTIQAMGAHFVVMRHSRAGAPHFLARHVTQGSVINAGDGAHEHPTQALLDLFTMREALGRIEGLRIAIVGDCLHSRVTRSNIKALTKLGAKTVLVGPTPLVPDELEALGVEVRHDLREGIQGADVVYLLRIQLERQRKGLFPSLKEYRSRFGLDTQALAWAKPDALIMHPGPVNRGVELTDEILESPRCKITTQVATGVFIRMAVLTLLGSET